MRLGLAVLAVAAATGLSGCEYLIDGVEVGQLGADLEYPMLERGAYRAYASGVSETPFAGGPVSVIAAENGHLGTWRLTPCGGGTAICADTSAQAGQIELTPDYAIVTGLYGRTFWLSPGGDGAVVSGGVAWPAAWD